VIFFPWQNDPAYCDARPQALTEETIHYFAARQAWTFAFADSRWEWRRRKGRANPAPQRAW
jgi:hypothetical protein